MRCDRYADVTLQLGYVGFALDMYGQGILKQGREECMAMIKPHLDDRMGICKRRLTLAYETCAKLPQTDASKVNAT